MVRYLVSRPKAKSPARKPGFAFQVTAEENLIPTGARNSGTFSLHEVEVGAHAEHRAAGIALGIEEAQRVGLAIDELKAIHGNVLRNAGHDAAQVHGQLVVHEQPCIVSPLKFKECG